jgi:hypothetical protein
VQLGGRTAAAEPFEMTRGTLKEEAQAGAGQMAAYLNDKIAAGQSAKPAAAPAATGQESKSGGCPFSAMVAQMGLGTGSQAGASSGTALTWTADARDRLEKLPSFVRPMVQSSIESYAKRHGFSAITLQVMDDAKNDSNGVAWTPEAEKRLENIPDFIRPMARREIERLAQERGATTITAQVMDEAKEKFMKFM